MFIKHIPGTVAVSVTSMHMVSGPDSLRPAGLVWIASVLVGLPMLFVQKLEVGIKTTCRFPSHFRRCDHAAKL